MTPAGECRECGATMATVRGFYCECDECKARLKHIEQCGDCGNVEHYPGPRIVPADWNES